MPFIDLTHSFTAEMPVYPGDLPPLVQSDEASGGDFVHYQLETSMHVGTHIDAPFHCIPGGKRLAEFPVDHFTGWGVCVDARGHKEVDVELLRGVDLKEGDIVLICTEWSKKFREGDYFQAFPVFTEAFAQVLVNAKVKMVGVDTPSPDREPYAIHKILLGSEVLILENLKNVEALSGQAFRIFAFPPKFDWDGAPLRVVAEVL